jgi:hypothetical protein
MAGVLPAEGWTPRGGCLRHESLFAVVVYLPYIVWDWQSE